MRRKKKNYLHFHVVVKSKTMIECQTSSVSTVLHLIIHQNVLFIKSVCCAVLPLLFGYHETLHLTTQQEVGQTSRV